MGTGDRPARRGTAVTDIAYTAVLLAAGYLAGRWRPGRWLLDWADDASRLGWADARCWAAQPVLAAALAWQLTVHPVRSARNRRSWREAQALAAHRSPPADTPENP